MSAPAKTRTRRSAADKARETLDAANVRFAKAEEKRNRLRDELKAADQELAEADKLARYAASHPDLPQKTSDG